MRVACADCGRTYDDAARWTLCPHLPLEFGPKPYHPLDNPSGYCPFHDLAGPHAHEKR